MNSSVRQEETGANEMDPVQAWVFLGPEERKYYKSFFPLMFLIIQARAVTSAEQKPLGG